MRDIVASYGTREDDSKVNLSKPGNINISNKGKKNKGIQ